jgi:hypothetical protein
MAKKAFGNTVLRILDESGTRFRCEGKSTSERNLKGYPVPQKSSCFHQLQQQKSLDYKYVA